MHDRLRDSPALRDHVRLVTLSFDPAHDTPAAMRRYASGAIAERTPGIEWTFLTTGSPRELWPILDGFGQDVQIERRPRPGPPARLGHAESLPHRPPRNGAARSTPPSYLCPPTS